MADSTIPPAAAEGAGMENNNPFGAREESDSFDPLDGLLTSAPAGDGQNNGFVQNTKADIIDFDPYSNHFGTDSNGQAAADTTGDSSEPIVGSSDPFNLGYADVTAAAPANGHAPAEEGVDPAHVDTQFGGFDFAQPSETEQQDVSRDDDVNVAACDPLASDIADYIAADSDGIRPDDNTGIYSSQLNEDNASDDAIEKPQEEGLADAADTPEVKDAPAVTESPDIQDIPDIQSTPDDQITPEVQDTPDIQSAPDDQGSAHDIEQEGSPEFTSEPTAYEATDTMAAAAAAQDEAGIDLEASDAAEQQHESTAEQRTEDLNLGADTNTAEAAEAGQEDDLAGCSPDEEAADNKADVSAQPDLMPLSAHDDEAPRTDDVITDPQHDEQDQPREVATDVHQSHVEESPMAQQPEEMTSAMDVEEPTEETQAAEEETVADAEPAADAGIAAAEDTTEPAGDPTSEAGEEPMASDDLMPPASEPVEVEQPGIPRYQSDPMTDSMYGELAQPEVQEDGGLPAKSVAAWDNGFDDNSDEQDTLRAEARADVTAASVEQQQQLEEPVDDVIEDAPASSDARDVMEESPAAAEVEPAAHIGDGLSDDESKAVEAEAAPAEEAVVATEDVHATVDDASTAAKVDDAVKEETRETDLDALIAGQQTRDTDRQETTELSAEQKSEPIASLTTEPAPASDTTASSEPPDIVTSAVTKSQDDVIRDITGEKTPEVIDDTVKVAKPEKPPVSAEKTPAVKTEDKKPTAAAKSAKAPGKKTPGDLSKTTDVKKTNDVKAKSTSARLSSKAKTNLSAESPRDKVSSRLTAPTKASALRSSASDVKRPTSVTSQPKPGSTLASTRTATSTTTARSAPTPRKAPTPRAPAPAKPSSAAAKPKTEKPPPTRAAAPPRTSTTVTKRVPPVTKSSVTGSPRPASTPARTTATRTATTGTPAVSQARRKPTGPSAAADNAKHSLAAGTKVKTQTTTKKSFSTVSSKSGTMDNNAAKSLSPANSHRASVSSKIGSLDNAKHKPKGGDRKIETQKLDWSATSKVGSHANEHHKPGGGNVKIETQKLSWNTSSKVGSMANSSHKPGGGETKIRADQSTDWKASSKIDSLSNAKHHAGGGTTKVVTNLKLDFNEKAHSKVGSMDHAAHKAGGGTTKIETQKLNFRERAQSKVGSLPAGPSKSPQPSPQPSSSPPVDVQEAADAENVMTSPVSDDGLAEGVTG